MMLGVAALLVALGRLAQLVRDKLRPYIGVDPDFLPETPG